MKNEINQIPIMRIHLQKFSNRIKSDYVKTFFQSSENSLATSNGNTIKSNGYFNLILKSLYMRVILLLDVILDCHWRDQKRRQRRAKKRTITLHLHIHTDVRAFLIRIWEKDSKVFINKLYLRHYQPVWLNSIVICGQFFNAAQVAF